MRLTNPLVSAFFLLSAIAPNYALAPAVAVNPNPALPGQQVTFRWFFTGDKVVVSGGRFGKGTVVTGRTSLSDKPSKTTRYNFDVWYKGQPAGGDTTAKSPLHAHYTVVVEVENPKLSPLTYYRDTRGWQVGYLKGWKHDSVSLPDAANNALIYFQKEDDSVERLAVSMLPAAEMTCDDLVKKVQSSLPTSYDQVEIVSQTPVTHAGAPAVLTTFTAIDQTHPGTRTQSVVLSFIRDGHAYVISARTNASQYNVRHTMLEKMVRSFAFTGTSASASAAK